jgi:hypothetical protein
VSTDWGYACLSHDPPIVMGDAMVNHAFDALVAALPAVRAGAWPMMLSYPGTALDDSEPAPIVGTTGDASGAPIRFLLDHPRCRIAVFNEYGETWFTDDGPHQVSGFDDRRARRPVRNAEGVVTEWVHGVYPPEGESVCSCYTPTPAVSHPRLLSDWVRCTACGGTHLTARPA